MFLVKSCLKNGIGLMVYIFSVKENDFGVLRGVVRGERKCTLEVLRYMCYVIRVTLYLVGGNAHRAMTSVKLRIASRDDLRLLNSSYDQLACRNPCAKTYYVLRIT